MNDAFNNTGTITVYIQNVIRKPEGKRPLRKPGRRWEDNIQMKMKRTGRSTADWVHLDEDRHQWRELMKTVMNFGFHKRWGISWLPE
jgi:hypothetical protein